MNLNYLILFLAVCSINIDVSYQWPRKGSLIWKSEMNSVSDINSLWYQATYGNSWSWGNNEMQHYTNKNKNIFVQSRSYRTCDGRLIDILILINILKR